MMCTTVRSALCPNEILTMSHINVIGSRRTAVSNPKDYIDRVARLYPALETFGPGGSHRPFASSWAVSCYQQLGDFAENT